MKKIASIILALTVALSGGAGEGEYKEYSWFTQRCGADQPPICSEEALINKYNGFSINRRVTDQSEDKVIYLTFDAGYENGNVERIVDILYEENVTAAFFLLDNIILKNTDLVTKMKNQGNLICNHTKSHKNLCKKSDDEIRADLIALEAIYTENTGFQMDKYFRFPEGRFSEAAMRAVSDMGYKTVFWSFAYDDWDNSRQPRPDAALKKILSNTHNGAIILLHPTSKTNADIMKTLITEWRKMGYRFGTLDEI